MDFSTGFRVVYRVWLGIILRADNNCNRSTVQGIKVVRHWYEQVTESDSAKLDWRHHSACLGLKLYVHTHISLQSDKPSGLDLFSVWHFFQNHFSILRTLGISKYKMAYAGVLMLSSHNAFFVFPCFSTFAL